MKVIIIDYDAGNLRNVQKALDYHGVESIISNSPNVVSKASSLILPGVGAFGHGMRILSKNNLIQAIEETVAYRKKAILGICLGMQLLATSGTEHGFRSGLGLLPMVIDELTNDPKIRKPHMGWDNIDVRDSNGLLQGIDNGADFYFAHSYIVTEHEKSICSASCFYGSHFPVVVEQDNVFGVQFHPEKSQKFGLKLISNFIRIAQEYA